MEQLGVINSLYYADAIILAPMGQSQRGRQLNYFVWNKPLSALAIVFHGSAPAKPVIDPIKNLYSICTKTSEIYFYDPRLSFLMINKNVLQWSYLLQL